MKLHHTLLLGATLFCFGASVFGADQAAQDLYKAKCQSCHGAGGKATAIGKKMGAKDFQDPDVVEMTEEEIVQITKDGKNKMPAYKGKLTDKQITELAKYIKEMK